MRFDDKQSVLHRLDSIISLAMSMTKTKAVKTGLNDQLHFCSPMSMTLSRMPFKMLERLAPNHLS